MHGKACIDAANKLMNAMRKPDGTFRTYDEMKKEGIPTKYRGVHPTLGTTQDIDPNTGHGSPNPEYNYAVFLSEVEVDVKTGKTKVLKMTGNFDVGVIGNKLAVEGQAYGGMAQAIGMALSEDFEDPAKDINLIKLGLPFIDDVPDELELNFLETPRPTGPFGAAGCAECFITGFPSVLNAIHNAVGVRIHELPARPAKVLKAMKDLEAGKASKPKKYWLGMEFKDRMQYIKDRPMKGTGFDISAEGGLRKDE
jgi:aldehyde oxidoreductase